MKDKPISLKKLSWIMALLGIFLIALYFIAQNSIIQLGFRSTDEYDAARDSYLIMMFGGNRFTSGSAVKDIFMDMRGIYLYTGIFMTIIGLVGVLFFLKHPEKSSEMSVKDRQEPNDTIQIPDQQGGDSKQKSVVDDSHQQPTVLFSTRSLLSEDNKTRRFTGMSNQYQQGDNQATGELTKTKYRQGLMSQLHTPGQKKLVLIFALIATVCFIAGFLPFPYSLLSIAAGLSLVFFVIKIKKIQSLWAILPVLLFDARFYFAGLGNGWITVLYRICSYGFLAIIIFMDVGDDLISFIEIEDDDISLLANVLTCVGFINAAFASIEFIRGLGFNFWIIMFRLGSIAFWLSLALYYRYVEKPSIRKSAEVFEGKQPHPYHRINGSLRNLVIGIYIAAAVCFIAVPVILVNYFSMLYGTASTGLFGYNLSVFFMKITIVSMLILAIVLLLSGLFLLWVNRKIRLRRHTFLLYLEYACFAIVMTAIAVIFAVNIWVGILLTIIAVVGSYALIKWVSRSVQIRTYMASKEYLKHSVYYMLKKNEPRPQPADTSIGCQPEQEAPQATDQNNSISDSGEDEWEIVEPTAEIYDEDEWEIDQKENAEPQVGPEDGQSKWQIVTDQNGVHKHEKLHRIPVREDICCICGHFLRNGYAVLMTDSNGAEARVDEKCWYAIQTIMREPNDQGNDSVQYLENQLPYIDPLVGKTLAEQIAIYRSKLNPDNQ